MSRARVTGGPRSRAQAARYGAGTVAGAVAAALLAVPPSAAAGTVLHVCPRGCAYSQIQPAVDAAAAGDTIRVGSGTYAGGIAIGKALTLTGSGPRSTVISGGGPVITVSAGPVVIQRVTVTGGNAPGDGGGILNTGTLTVLDAIIRADNAGGMGGGIANDGTDTGGAPVTSLVLRGVTLIRNVAAGDGGGLANAGASAQATATGTAFRRNSAGQQGGGVAGGGSTRR